MCKRGRVYNRGYFAIQISAIFFSKEREKGKVFFFFFVRFCLLVFDYWRDNIEEWINIERDDDEDMMLIRSEGKLKESAV